MKHLNRHTIFLYLVALSLLYGGAVYSSRFLLSGHYREIELRQLAHPAAVSGEYEAALTRMLTRGRHWTVHALAGVKQEALHTSLTPKVLIGKDGWLFLQQEEDRPVVHQSLRVYQYAPKELRHWALLLRQRKYWAELRGMDYVPVVVPNKATVYPEFLPDRFRPVAGPRTTEQLQAALPELPLIDLTDSIRSYKSREQLFLKHDTHWNELGAFFAYRALMRALPPPYRDVPLDLSQCALRRDTMRGGDLARMILEDKNRSEHVPRLEVRHPRARFLEDRSQTVAPNVRPMVYAQADTTRPRAFFDHDSFFRDLGPFFAEHFSESTYLWGWQGFHTELILNSSPDLIIDEFVERALTGLTPRNDWPVVQDYWQAHFSSLPELAHLEDLTFEELLPTLQRLDLPEDKLAILQLRSQPEKTDKLVIDFGGEEGFYWLHAEGDIYYLEYETGRIHGFRVEGGTPCRIDVVVKLY